MAVRSTNNGVRVRVGYVTSGTRLPTNTILISPVDDGWNDFGLRTHISYVVNLRGKPVLTASAYFGCRLPPPQNDADVLRGMLAGRKRRMGPMPPSFSNGYFTMLRSMEDYRRIVAVLGPGAAKEVLLAVNDVVAILEYELPGDLAREATSSDVFAMSFLRSQESYFAYKNAGPILRGLTHERLGAMSRRFDLRFKLASARNSHQLTFHFDHKADLPKRIAIVIGKNGVGKSLALKQIVHALTGKSGELTESGTGARPVVSRLLAFAPTNETESVFPSDQIRNPAVWYRRFSLNRSRAGRSGVSVTDLIRQVARSEQSIGRRTRWRILLDALETIGGSHEICLPMLKGNSPAYLPIAELRSGSEQYRLQLASQIDARGEPVRSIDGEGYALSSGEISFLRFAAQVSLNIENGTLLLLDEPETHLHPNFISRFVALLDRLLADTGSAAIIATHSAYFVREVFREQVTVLSRDERGFVHAQHPAMPTFGADVGQISYFVFGEDESSLLATQVKNRLLRRKATWRKLFRRYKDDFSLEFLNSLRAGRGSA